MYVALIFKEFCKKYYSLSGYWLAVWMTGVGASIIEESWPTVVL